MANIFVAFYNGISDPENPNAMPIFYQGFIEGLIKAGNNVYTVAHSCFGCDFEQIDEDLKEQIKRLKLDICFIFSNAFYDLSDIVDCPIVIYEADTPIYYSNKEVLKRKPERFIYFVAQTDSAAVIQREFGVSSDKIFYVSLFTEIYAEDVEKTTNISFIGSKFNPNPLYLPHSFWRLLSNEEKGWYKKCVETIKNNPNITSEELMVLHNIKSENIKVRLNIKEILMYLSGERRIQLLSALADLGLDLYGTESWGKEYFYNSELTMSFCDKKVYSLTHNQEILNSSRIGINISHLQATSGFPWRVMDIMASDACLVTDYHSDFEKLFPGLKIPTYTSIYEARELCKKLIDDDVWRREVVLQCQEAVNEKFRFRNLLQKLEEYSGVNMGYR